MYQEFLEKWLKATQHISTRYFFIAGTAFLIFYVLFKNYFSKYKIQAKFPTIKENVRELLYSFQTILWFSTVAVLVFWKFSAYTNIYLDINEYGKAYFFLTFPLMFIIHDTYFYWIHRLMHLPSLYKYVHRIHHLSTNPTPLTSYAFHPLESFMESLILPIIAFTLPVHRSALIIFFLMQFIYNVYGHLGYELYPKNFHKTWVGKWINTSVSHNMHHKYFHKNYGLYFLFWDRIMGTLDARYDAHFEEAKERKG